MASEDKKAERVARIAEQRARYQAAMTVTGPPREGETFEQFTARHMEVQSRAAQKTAQDVSTIKVVVVTWAIVTAAFLLYALAEISS